MVPFFSLLNHHRSKQQTRLEDTQIQQPQNGTPTEIMKPKLSRILHLTAFTFLSIVLFCLILLTPSDAIYQCYITQRLINIFFIAGAYIVTFLLAVLIYATRIYTNRSVLTGIPKAWIPVEKEDVGGSVRRLVMEGLARSADIAYQARPRDVAAEEQTQTQRQSQQVQAQQEQGLVVNRDRPPWGNIEHPGWSSPESRDLPDLPYRTVIQELPHLIEAKAVSLAPPDPVFTATSYNPQEGGLEQEQAVPDTRVVEVLQRQASMGVREYIQRLTVMEVIRPPEVGAEFVVLYERARFSAHELFESEFRELMHVFAEVLRGMKGLGPEKIMKLEADYFDGSGSDEGSIMTSSGSLIGPSDEEGETDTMDYSQDDGSLRLRHSSSGYGSSSREDYYSNYATPRSRMSAAPFPNRAWYEHPSSRRMLAPRTPSMQSLRRVRSNVSGSSGGSVIRLADRGDIPYTFDSNV